MRNTWIAITILASPIAWAGPDAPLPPDVNVVAPSSDVPAPLAGLSGHWSGTWVGGGDRLNHVLVIESISATAFSAVYAWGDSMGQNRTIAAGWRRVNGTVDGGQLKAALGKASVVYVINSDGTISGTYTNARGFDSKATLKKT